jgi:predicted AAA+ superfamily ATPase
MPLKRSITNELEEWYETPSHKALLVTGARQVGKTFAIREFAREHYESVLEINFAETPSARAIFEGDLDADTLIANLTEFREALGEDDLEKVRALLDRGRALREEVLLRQHLHHTGTD